MWNGCSNRPSSKAAGESKTGGITSGYVEDFAKPRTKLEAGFNIRQWRKWRMAVIIIASPCSSAALTISASRIEPPG